MPYDKEMRDALQAYYEAHDFTGNIPAFDDKRYTPAQLQIYAKAKKFFAQSWLKLLPETGNKRSMRNFSKNYPLNCLKEGDAAYIADMVAEIMGDEKQFKASIDKFFFDLQEPLEAGLRACAKAHGKTPEELTDKEIEDVVDKLAGLFMEEMINALMTAQKTPEIFAALHKGVPVPGELVQHGKLIGAVGQQQGVVLGVDIDELVREPGERGNLHGSVVDKAARTP